MDLEVAGSAPPGYPEVFPTLWHENPIGQPEALSRFESRRFFHLPYEAIPLLVGAVVHMVIDELVEHANLVRKLRLF